MLVHIQVIDQASLVRTMKAFSLNNDIFISSANMAMEIKNIPKLCHDVAIVIYQNPYSTDEKYI
jgi:hypothetical protein